MDENNKKQWLKVLWIIAILFLTLWLGVGGGCVIAFMSPANTIETTESQVVKGIFGALWGVTGLIVGVVSAVRVWRWFDKK